MTTLISPSASSVMSALEGEIGFLELESGEPLELENGELLELEYILFVLSAFSTISAPTGHSEWQT